MEGLGDTASLQADEVNATVSQLESVDPCAASEIIQALGVTLGADAEFLVSGSAILFWDQVRLPYPCIHTGAANGL